VVEVDVVDGKEWVYDARQQQRLWKKKKGGRRYWQRSLHHRQPVPTNSTARRYFSTSRFPFVDCSMIELQ
jgi:hypothetical protein